jgi:hypothetical protein
MNAVNDGTCGVDAGAKAPRMAIPKPRIERWQQNYGHPMSVVNDDETIWAGNFDFPPKWEGR